VHVVDVEKGRPKHGHEVVFIGAVAGQNVSAGAALDLQRTHLRVTPERCHSPIRFLDAPSRHTISHSVVRKTQLMSYLDSHPTSTDGDVAINETPPAMGRGAMAVTVHGKKARIPPLYQRRSVMGGRGCGVGNHA